MWRGTIAHSWLSVRCFRRVDQLPGGTCLPQRRQISRVSNRSTTGLQSALSKDHALLSLELMR